MKKINIFSLVTGILGALCIAFAVATIVIAVNQPANEGSIGIIGGADDAFLRDVLIILLVRSWQFIAILLGVALILTSLFTAIFKKTTENCLTIKTSVTAILISAMFAVVVYSFSCFYPAMVIGSLHWHPVAYPCHIAAFVIALVALVILIAQYCFKFRKAKPSAKGVIIDILTAIVYVPFMYFAFIKFTQVLSRIVNIILS